MTPPVEQDMIFLSPFLLILGLLQLVAAHNDLRGVSLTGRYRRLGYLTGGILFLGGAILLPATPWVLIVVLPAGALALVSLVALGSLVASRLLSRVRRRYSCLGSQIGAPETT